MRKIIVGEFISLDGVVEAPEQWHMTYASPEMFNVMWGLSDACDTTLLGRVTYEGFAAAFADAPADNPVAAKMNKNARVVVSRTLRDLDWANSTVLEGELEEGIAALKATPGGDILTTGSTTLVQSLLRAGLVDELHLLIHPVVVGEGRRLFEQDNPLSFTLGESAALPNGVVHAVYRPVSAN
ncbi:dihydrofolate reductase family protein [Microbacterium yannicii]|uniref:Dihydrofolate reductase family protein n=1 Tax=Microbacterium yannicii TaxID=671622 RepID=A0ABP9ME06_9MICO|nr:dihydrofolate reductase family protein [Microbacterium yannicii]MCO5953485.1 dihydrofolate reductase family protein [Microbacterium yannicii]